MFSTCRTPPSPARIWLALSLTPSPFWSTEGQLLWTLEDYRQYRGPSSSLIWWELRGLATWQDQALQWCSLSCSTRYSLALSRLTFIRQQLEFPQPVPAPQIHSPNALWHCLGNVKPPKSQTWSPLSITVSPFYSQRGGVSRGLCSGCHGDSLFPFPTRMEPVFSDHLGRGLKNKPQI